MKIKKIHSLSGLVITLFIGLHLFNHCYSIFGAHKHIELMNTLRLFYRNILIESIILIAVALQILSGIFLYQRNRKNATDFFEKLHVLSGLYLAVFFVIHLSAILVGRFFWHLDTNFYFGVAGINSFPINLFFIPYYALAILSFFGHIASIHRKKMKVHLFWLTPYQQAIAIVAFGSIVMIIIFYGLTNQFQGVEIPTDYKILIGQ